MIGTRPRRIGIGFSPHKHTTSTKVVEAEVVLGLFGGKWPVVDGFDFDLIDEFRITDTGYIQGYICGEPIGNSIKYDIRARTIDEEIANMFK